MSAKRKPQNPYVAGRAISSPQGFFGRQDIFQAVEEVLASPDENAIVLFGQRRIGKTSILFQLRDRLRRAGYITTYFDLMYKTEKPLGNVLYELASRIAPELSLSDLPKESDFDDQGVFFQKTFLPIVYKTLGEDTSLVLLFDEFDVLDAPTEHQLSPTTAAKAFFPYLWNLMEEERQLQFVFVVGRKAEELSTDALAVFRAARYERVSVLTREDAIALITQAEKTDSLHLAQEAIERIYDLTNGHPFLTQLLCHNIFNQAWVSDPQTVPTISMEDVENAVSRALEQGMNQLEWIWGGLPPAEKVVMAAIAGAGDRVISKDDLLKILQQHGIRILSQQLELAPETLVKWELLKGVEGGYRFFIELIRRWIANTKPLPKVKDELDRIDPLADLHFRTGERYHQMHQYRAATVQLRQALNLNPNHFKARLLLGEALREEGAFAKAVEELEKAFRQDEDGARYRLLQALLDLGQTLETESNSDAALAAYERALAISPGEQVADERRRVIWKHRGDKLVEAGGIEAALEAYKLAGEEESVSRILKRIETEERLARLYAEGRATLRAREWSKAEKALAEVIYLQSDYRDAVQLLAHAHAHATQLQDKDGKLSQVKVELKETDKVGVPLKPLLPFRCPAWIPWTLGLIVVCVGIIVGIPFGTANSGCWIALVILIGIFAEGSILELTAGEKLNLPGSLDEFIAADSNGGTQIAMVGNDGIVRVWSLVENKEIASTRGHRSTKRICLLRDQPLIILATGHSWNFTTNEKTRLLPKVAGKYDSLAVSADNQMLATSKGRPGIIRLFTIPTEELIAELQGHTDQVRCLAFSPTGELLASGGDVHIWNLATRKLMHRLAGHVQQALSLAFDPSGQVLASGGSNGVVRIWDITTPNVLRFLPTDTTSKGIVGLAFSSGGLLLASGSEDGTVQVWDIYCDECVAETKGSAAILELRFSPDGKQLLAVCRDGTIYRWEVVVEDTAPM